MTTIATIVATILGSVGAYFTWKSSTIRQRRLAESDVAVADDKFAAKKDEIRAAVYENDDEKLNRIVSRLLSPVLFFVASCAIFLGCAHPAEIVYIPTDRRIETVTNSLGIVCKAVPNALMDEMLVKLQELQDLKTELKVKSHLEK